MNAGEAERRSLDALGRYFVGDVSLAEVLEGVCQAAVDAIQPAVMAGVSMTVDGRPGTYVFTHPEVEQIDQPQYDTGDGPCVDAFRTGRTVIIDDTEEDGPYAAFRHVAVAHRLFSTISLPMTAGDATVGALNLYARLPHSFTQHDAGAGSIFATHAGYALINHQAYWEARNLSENLREAMQSRADIEQAKGIIMATTGFDPDSAFEQLRAQSQAEHVKVRDLAREIVKRAHRPR